MKRLDVKRLATRATPVLLLAFTPLLLLAGPASAADLPLPGSHVTVTTHYGATFDAVAIDDNGDGHTNGYDYIDDATGKPGFDGKIDGVDDDGDLVIDHVQGGVTNAPTITTSCGIADFTCAASSIAHSAAVDALQAIADAITTAVGNVIVSLGTLWVNIGTPDLAQGSVVEWLRGNLAFYTGLAAVCATIFGGARMAIAHRAQPGNDLAAALVRLMVVNGTSVALIAAGVAGGDAFSTWIIGQSTAGTDFGANMLALMQLTALTGLGVVVVIVLGVTALGATFVQIILMIARGGLLVITTSVLPLAASFTNIPAGRSWYQKIVGWTVAAVLYKPAAAIVYSVAFRLAGQHVFGSDGLISVLTGLMLMVMALFALPALMRLAVPLVQASASSSGGGGSGAALAGGAVASGAQILTLRATSSGGGGSGGGGSSWGGSSSGPSGASPSGGPTGASPSGGFPSGGSGPSGSSGPAGASTGGSRGAGAAGGSAAGGGAAGGAAAAGGPPGALVGAGVQAGQAAAGAIRGTANKAADPGGADT